MKTLRLTKAESAAYAAGGRRFWRAMRKQPDKTLVAVFVPQPTPEPYWNVGGFRLRQTATNPYRCPYGCVGSYLIVPGRGVCGTIAAIAVDQRDGKWGWLLEVGA